VIRLRFTKNGKIRFLGHRDVANLWARALRRGGMPMAYSEGYTPRPKLAFGLALPTGCASDGEFIDLHLNQSPLSGQFSRTGGQSCSVAELPQLLSKFLPVGMDVTAAAEMSSGGMSLQQAVTCCDWRVELRGMSEEDATNLVQCIMDAVELPVQRVRKGRNVVEDVRPGIRVVSVTQVTEIGATLDMSLDTQPRTVRPTQVLDAVLPNQPLGEVRRLFQWIERDGERREPLSADAPNAPHTELCAR